MKKIILLSLTACFLSSWLFGQLPKTELPVSIKPLELPVKKTELKETVQQVDEDFDFDEEYDLPLDDYRSNQYPADNLAEILPPQCPLEGFRILDEVNDQENVDAYPWISSDGLRLYFTQKEKDSKRDIFVMASRKDINCPFGPPQKMNVNIPNINNMSCWLSQDELEIYFCSNNSEMQFYNARRRNLLEEFGPPTNIRLNSPIDLRFFTSPSLSPDGKQLFLYTSTEEGQQIFQFIRDNEFEFTQTGVLALPDMLTPNPGQLSANGLRFYVIADNTTQMYVFERNNLEEEFIQHKVVDMGEDFHQLAISPNEKYMVLCFSRQNLWEKNDLYLAQGPFVTTTADAAIELAANSKEAATSNIAVDILLFPNPTQDYVNVQFQLPDFGLTAALEIFDLQGRVISSQQVKGAGLQSIRIDLSSLAAGTYFCRIQGKDIHAVAVPLVVR